MYKKDIDKLKTRNSTLEVLIQAILNYPEEEVPALIKSIRTCEPGYRCGGYIGEGGGHSRGGR